MSFASDRKFMDFAGSNPGSGAEEGGHWVTINGAHVFVKGYAKGQGQGGKAEMNHTPHNLVDKPASHAPGHENTPSRTAGNMETTYYQGAANPLHKGTRSESVQSMLDVVHKAERERAARERKNPALKKRRNIGM